MKNYRFTSVWNVVCQVTLTKSQRENVDLVQRAFSVIADESFDNVIVNVSECGEVTKIQKNGYRIRVTDTDNESVIQLLKREHELVCE